MPKVKSSNGVDATLLIVCRQIVTQLRSYIIRYDASSEFGGDAGKPFRSAELFAIGQNTASGRPRALWQQPEIPMRFLFPGAAARLEPLCGSAAYWVSNSGPRPCVEQGLAGPLSRHRPRSRGKAEIQQKEPGSMLDIVLIGVGVLFFALSFAYATACERL
jgi:hypothetical protein